MTIELETQTWRERLNQERDEQRQKEAMQALESEVKRQRIEHEHALRLAEKLRALGLPVENPKPNFSTVVLDKYEFRSRSDGVHDIVRVTLPVEDTISDVPEFIIDMGYAWQIRQDLLSHRLTGARVVDCLDELDSLAAEQKLRNAQLLAEGPPAREKVETPEPEQILVVCEYAALDFQRRLNQAVANGWRLVTAFDSSSYMTAVMTKEQSA